MSGLGSCGRPRPWGNNHRDTEAQMKKKISRRELFYTAAGAAAVPALRPVAPQTSKLRLTMSCWDYDRTRALMEGRVAFDGIELTYLPLVVEETFFRMLRYKEFDVAEMSL